jgi:transcriptional regulator with XRE-family HTH domain
MPSVKKPPHKRRRTYLAEWRKYKNYSQERVAEIIGVDQTTISRLERSVVPYDQDILERLSNVYGCEPHELLTWNPLLGPEPKLVWDRVNQASPKKRDEIFAVVNTMLKAS